MIKLKRVTKKVSQEEVKAWAINLLKFTAPVLAIFFALLAQGVAFDKAYPVALFALYGALADWLKKFTEVK